MTALDCVVVGAADMVSPSGSLGMSRRQLEVEAILAALHDAQLPLSDVDALFCVDGALPGLDLAEYLGARPRITDSTMTGGSAPVIHVHHAAMALTMRACDVAVVVNAGAPRFVPPGHSPAVTAGPGLSPDALEWELPFGSGIPVVAYALAAARHAHEYGTTPNQLAEIAVAARQWATMNPRARYREPLTIDEVLGSPMVAEPLRRSDCCLHTDGAAAVVLTRRDRSADRPTVPVYVTGAGASQSHAMSITQMPDLTITPGRESGRQALTQAGVTVADVDVLQTYDSFTITVLTALEDLGFCAKGEGGAFVEGGRLGPGGSLPANTSGGGLSYTHPGMFGAFLLVEAVRQLRRDSGLRQVPDARCALVHGVGGLLSSTATLVLTNEAP